VGAAQLNNVPKVMKGKKKNEDAEKKDEEENGATVSTSHNNGHNEEQANSGADDDTKHSVNGETTAEVENHAAENEAKEEAQAEE
jgi:hypothetical protein